MRIVNYPIPTQWHLLTPLGPLENTVGKGEIARNEQFLLFPQCFLPIWITFCHFRQIWNCRLQTLSVWKSLKFVVWYWVKEKVLVNSIFFFSCNVFKEASLSGCRKSRLCVKKFNRGTWISFFVSEIKRLCSFMRIVNYAPGIEGLGHIVLLLSIRLSLSKSKNSNT